MRISFDLMTLMIGSLNTIIIITLLTIGIYSFLLFIKLAKKGIKSLNIYIEKIGRNTFNL